MKVFVGVRPAENARRFVGAVQRPGCALGGARAGAAQAARRSPSHGHPRQCTELAHRRRRGDADALRARGRSAVPCAEGAAGPRSASGPRSVVEAPALAVWNNGMACMLFSGLALSLMGLTVKLAHGVAIPTLQTIVARSVVQAAVSLLMLSRSELKGADKYLGPRGTRRLLFFRATSGFVGITSLFTSITLLPLGDATAISLTSPIITAMAAALFLGEPWTLQVAAAGVTSFAGVLLISQPEFLPWVPSEAVGPAAGLGVALGVLGAICQGMALIVLRRVGKRNVPALVPVLLLSLVCAFCGGSILTFNSLVPGSVLADLPVLGASWAPVAPSGLALLSLTGSFAFLGQVLMSRGMQLEEAGRGSAVSYLQVVFSLVLGAAVLGERTGVSSAVGTVMILGSAFSLAAEPKKARERSN
ncbi:unnamed protein product [Pedinophyceae sp. YPF-701]|nr:unnamed protein product [Pedinophyceae sp. YPF-701]